MKIDDFSIGKRFFTVVGEWVCTDVGSRTIAAIRLPTGEYDDLAGATLDQWLQGPPYVLPEVVFNEKDINQAYTNWEQSIADTINEGRFHPGFSSEDVRRLFDRTSRNKTFDALIKHERVDGDGLLHPYKVTGKGTEAVVHVLEVFTRDWRQLSVPDFLALPVATPSDIRALAKRLKHQPRINLETNDEQKA